MAARIKEIEDIILKLIKDNSAYFVTITEVNVNTPSSTSYSSAEIEFHWDLLIDSGYIERETGGGGSQSGINHPVGLTMEGYERLKAGPFLYPSAY